MDIDSEPPSVFVVVYYYNEDPNFSFLQLDIPGPNSAPKQVKNVDYVVRFDEPRGLPPMRWTLSSVEISTGDMYFVPDWRAVQPLHGYKFNFNTASFHNIPHSPSIKNGRCVSAVNLGGRCYRLERHVVRLPDRIRIHLGFGCYDPEKNSWKELKAPSCLGFDSIVKATAVWNDDTILFNVHNCGIWVYDVGGDEWYRVHMKDNACRSIVGEAVVLKETIYALTDMFPNVVLALSIVKERRSGDDEEGRSSDDDEEGRSGDDDDDDDDDVVFKCSIRSQISLPVLSRNRPIKSPEVRSRHLVHLGKADFCLVEGCVPLVYTYPKPINVTYMRLEGQTKMTKLSDCWFETRHHNLSDVVGCFSLPKSRTSVLEDGKRFVFRLDPYTAVPPSVYVGDLPPNVAVTQPETAVPPSIYVGDLPPDVTATQLEKVLKKYGPIKKDGIQVKKNKKGKCFAFVVFESVSSKQRAIKASTVTLEGRPAKISEKT